MELTAEQKEKLQEIGDKFHLRFIILHGSYAKGIPRKGSNLDIAVVGKERIKLDGILTLHGELS